MNMLTYASPLGPLLIAASTQGISGVYFESHRHFKGSAAWHSAPEHPLLLAAELQLQQYFAGIRVAFDLPLDISGGTAFQQTVWRALQTIPAGVTRSYSELAQSIGKPGAVRAVGSANARNPLSILIPCHRVIAASGALSGYAGGLQNKQDLLAFEAKKHQFSTPFYRPENMISAANPHQA
ncbi:MULTISPECIES: methylated-DNA--[protein]-cysteine S-methyltransferase [unclassified Undibacterium]|uniref:methylated-DNA--[protein]-cysteine S-methyltransferase n=1 Tax=unclassified Undibacterium TaxID=2630295 RepID=UPI002AC94528|nr:MULTISPECIES: methylated-DNA--[protein]-cysteine S-methyltransferase [unclassified Undibacterium]MEB0138850.1 methylated-DNA--[protein]-cysteine S-methyltransferase [Undibacterium sp. CCC2.1]MEB0172288.1 methylated-DNA--[protein]-cysteine S-methyltransferase [Undibacterium sp. CCC1.1]MEB0176095.1 methylated-DNA--[protein]-cysteine S-methyltransferase [Undibacterium sp. CCC3.4]MEB0215944.1 methylated-DNA--[protein]-cysteine S-methyltransferase [Undibacterium sp. 5I2]WPX44763.1 methylated-DNA